MSTLGDTIKRIRINRGLTQKKVAGVLNIARSSYVAIEKGKRDVSLGEAERLSLVLGITVEEIYSRAAPNYDKYRQMMLSFLRTVSGDGKISKTKLAKYLYLADFAWFYNELESMSGMAYRKINFGLVSDQFFRAVDELEARVF